MDAHTSLSEVVDPVISMVPSPELRDTLRQAFSEEQAAVNDVEEFFRMLPSHAWSKELLHTFACSWKATHLKMLAIYGLSCRLQRMADDAGELSGPTCIWQRRGMPPRATRILAWTSMATPMRSSTTILRRL